MKKLLVILAILLMAGSAWGADYYVSAGGSNTAPYEDWTKASTTIATINALNPANGSYNIYLRPGDTFTDATLGLSWSWANTYTAVNIECIDGDSKTISVDGKTILGGDVRDAIVIDETNIATLTIKNIDVSGQDYAGSKSPKIWLKTPLNVMIDGVDADGSSGTPADTDCKYPIHIQDVRDGGDVEIKNCSLHYWGPAELWGSPELPGGTNVDYNCIHVVNYTSATGTLLIHDNDIGNCEGDGIALESILLGSTTSYNTKIYNNVIKNGGENEIDIKDSKYWEVNENILGRDATFIGRGGSSYDESTVLFGSVNIVDTATAGTAEYGAIFDNVIINRTGQAGISLERSSASQTTPANNEIYRNLILDTKASFRLQGGATHDNEFHHNVCSGIDAGGYFIFDQTSSQVNKFYFNSFYSAGTDIAYAHRIYSNADVAANITQIDDADAVYVYVEGGTPTVSSPNLWYNANETENPFNRWGVAKTLAEWNTLYSTTDVSGTPNYTTPASDDLTLQVTSTNAIDQGDLSALTLSTMDDISIHPDSVWDTTTPATGFDIITTAQADHNSSYELGAFVYPVGDPTPPSGNTTTDTDMFGYWALDNDLTDDKNSQTLTDRGTITYGTTSPPEGTHYAILDSGDYADVADGSLAAGFPGKSGGSETDMTIMAWFKAASSANVGIVAGKFDSGDTYSYAMLYADDNKFGLAWNNGSGGVSWYYHASTLADGDWYCGMATFTGSDNGYTLDVIDAGLDAVGSQATGTTASDMVVTAEDFSIGADGEGSFPFTGDVAAVTVWDDVKAGTDHLAWCQEAFGSDGTPSTFSVITTTETGTVASGAVNVTTDMSETVYVFGNPESAYFTITSDEGQTTNAYYTGKADADTLNFSTAALPAGFRMASYAVTSFTQSSMIIEDADANQMSDFTLPDNISDNVAVVIAVPINARIPEDYANYAAIDHLVSGDVIEIYGVDVTLVAEDGWTVYLRTASTFDANSNTGTIYAHPNATTSNVGSATVVKFNGAAGL